MLASLSFASMFTFTLAFGFASTASLFSYASAQGIYTCKDQYGRNLKSDRPIPECADREQRVLNADGSVKGVIASPEEQSKREADERRRREDFAAQNEQRRRDRVLIQRFPDVSTWERAMRDTLAGPVSTWEAAINRIGVNQKIAKSLDDEAEFYKKGKLPAALKRKMEENQFAIEAELRLIEAQKDDIRRIQTRYSQDLRKLYKLWAEGAGS